MQSSQKVMIYLDLFILKNEINLNTYRLSSFKIKYFNLQFSKNHCYLK